MATLLGDKSVGDVVKIRENGIGKEYVVVHKGKPSTLYDSSCDGVWLLRKQIYTNRTFSASDKYYEYGYIHPYLNGTFFGIIDSKISEYIKQIKIPYKSSTLKTGADGLSCKIFLLSAREVGFTKTSDDYMYDEGAKLSYFYSGDGTSAQNRRVAYNASGTAASWWTRSPSYDPYVWNVQPTGYAANSDAIERSSGVRPAFILPSTLLVDSSGYVTTNNPPTVTSDTPSGTSLGEISDAPEFSYSVSDEDGDPMTVSEYVDDLLTRNIDSPDGGTYAFGAISGENWKTVLNGSHTLKVVANDGKENSSAYTVTFNKQVRTATVSLAEPLPADDVIKAAAIAVTGHFPEDSTLSVLVTNNALDDSPVWEDMTASVANSSNHVFTNQTAENGFAFNFRITATRGASDEQGYISSIGGAFE